MNCGKRMVINGILPIIRFEIHNEKLALCPYGCEFLASGYHVHEQKEVIGHSARMGESRLMSDNGVNKGRRRFLVAATSVVGAAGVVGVATPFLKSWNPKCKS